MGGLYYVTYIIKEQYNVVFSNRKCVCANKNQLVLMNLKRSEVKRDHDLIMNLPPSIRVVFKKKHQTSSDVEYLLLDDFFWLSDSVAAVLWYSAKTAH